MGVLLYETHSAIDSQIPFVPLPNADAQVGEVF